MNILDTKNEFTVKTTISRQEDSFVLYFISTYMNKVI